MKVELDLQDKKEKIWNNSSFCLGKEYYENSEQNFFLEWRQSKENLVKGSRFRRIPSLSTGMYFQGKVMELLLLNICQLQCRGCFWSEQIYPFIKQVKSRSLRQAERCYWGWALIFKSYSFQWPQITVYKPKKEHIPSLTVDILIHTIVRPPSNFWHKENLCREKPWLLVKSDNKKLFWQQIKGRDPACSADRLFISVSKVITPPRQGHSDSIYLRLSVG